MTETATIKIIDSATDIYMDAFIDIMVNDKYSLLVKEGNPSENELKLAWNKIYNEYLDALQSNNYNDIVNTMKDVNILSFQHQRITTILQILTVYYNPELVKELRKMGYSIKYDRNNIEKYISDISRAYEKSKTLLVKIQVKQEQLDKLLKKDKQKAISRADFQSMFISLSEYAKYQVEPSKITAYQFAVMLKRCNNYAEQMHNSLNKSKGGASWQKN